MAGKSKLCWPRGRGRAADFVALTKPKSLQSTHVGARRPLLQRLKYYNKVLSEWIVFAFFCIPALYCFISYKNNPWRFFSFLHKSKVYNRVKRVNLMINLAWITFGAIIPEFFLCCFYLILQRLVLHTIRNLFDVLPELFF